MLKTRRNRPGTKAQDLWNWPFEEFSDISGPFAVQEYIQQLIRQNPSNVARICEPVPDVDRGVWQYEHMRQFIMELNQLIVKLQGSCNSSVCPTMKATSQFLYLCASHRPPQECSAIDYMIHTIDHASAILHNPNNFNSRVSVPNSSIQHLLHIARRLYRLFAHTYYNHRECFNEFEKERHLCARFTEFATRFNMMSANLFTIPTHAFAVQVS